MRQLAGTFLAVFLLWGVLPAQAQDFQLKKATHEQIKQAISENEASVKVVNFWATWCGPCRKEFPQLVRFGEDFADQGVDVVFVSMDLPEREPAVLRYLQEQNAQGVSYLKSGGSRAFVNAFSKKWKGGLPATFVYGPDGKQRAFWRGAVTYKKVRDRVTDILAKGAK